MNKLPTSNSKPPFKIGDQVTTTFFSSLWEDPPKKTKATVINIEKCKTHSQTGWWVTVKYIKGNQKRTIALDSGWFKKIPSGFFGVLKN